MRDYLEMFVLYVSFWSCGIVFSHPMERKKHFRRNSIIMIFFVLVLFLLFGNIIKDQPLMKEVVAKNLINLFMFFWVYTCWELSVTTAIYNTIWAISLWQLLYEVWGIGKVLLGAVFAKSFLIYLFALLMLMAGGHIICAFTIAKWMPEDRKKKIGPRQTISAILLFCVIEMLSYAPALNDLQVYNEDWKFIYLSQMMCIVILYLQNELFKKSEMKQELQLMNLLWKQEQEQYKLTKENIALINQKSHDLKHQIKALRKVNRGEYEKYLDEMEDSVLIYDAIVKTGNDVFDTILTEKSLYCKDRQIQVSCVADGSQMQFINTVDLYALLGNAMDNAIEAVEKFEETEKRQIDVMIYRQQNFLVMHVINPISEKLIYGEDELPVTTKGDKKIHGYGLRSMRHIVEKYDGHLSVGEEDGCFSVKMLVPIPNA